MDKFYKCGNCGLIFPDYHAARRKAVLEDSKMPWEWVDICWECGSDDLEVLDNCAVCGGPVEERGSDFCETCAELIDNAFKGAFLSAQNATGRGYKDTVRLMFDRAEEKGFYE